MPWNSPLLTRNKLMLQTVSTRTWRISCTALVNPHNSTFYVILLICIYCTVLVQILCYYFRAPSHSQAFKCSSIQQIVYKSHRRILWNRHEGLVLKQDVLHWRFYLINTLRIEKVLYYNLVWNFNNKPTSVFHQPACCMTERTCTSPRPSLCMSVMLIYVWG